MTNTTAEGTDTDATRVSVVVPVRNSAQTLSLLLERLAHLRTRLDALEVVLIDDGSRDASWDTINAIARQHAWVRGIRLMRNYGQHNALLCGIRSVTHAITVTMDDDLQHAPEDIPQLLAALGRQDVVYGTPAQQPHGCARNLAARLTKFALRGSMGKEHAAAVSAFRAFRTGLRDKFADYRSPHVSIDVLLAWSTNRFTSVAVAHAPRRHGRSNYTFSTLLTHALTMLTAFSTFPLQLASWIGLALTVFGVAVLGYVLVRYVVEGISVPGFPFLASIIALFSGAQLFALGIIGEYLARMHFRTLGRPAYAVREQVERPQ